jgi:uncharacterized RDD family membrane protein YckC
VEAAPIIITRDDLATPWQRFGAALLDGLVAAPFLVVTAFIFFTRDEVTGQVSFGAPWWFTVLSVMAFAAYEIVGTALWGQTLGKHAAGIRVCSGRDLHRPGWLRAAKRWGLMAAVGWVPFVGGLLSVLIPLPILWDQARQGLHDKFADTLVLQNRSVPWA